MGLSALDFIQTEIGQASEIGVTAELQLGNSEHTSSPGYNDWIKKNHPPALFTFTRRLVNLSCLFYVVTSCARHDPMRGYFLLSPSSVAAKGV